VLELSEPLQHGAGGFILIDYTRGGQLYHGMGDVPLRQDLYVYENENDPVLGTDEDGNPIRKEYRVTRFAEWQ
jgi:hypothetical protein